MLSVRTRFHFISSPPPFAFGSNWSSHPIPSLDLEYEHRIEMPQDPNLYGQRAPKRQKKETCLPSSLAFSAELSSLISTSKTPNTTTTAGLGTARPRPSKSKTDDIFAGVRAKRKAERQERDRDDGKLVLREVTTTEDEKNALLATRRRIEEKARLYAAMKRGDYVPKDGETEPLVDFDRKWAEAQEKYQHINNYNSSSSEDDEDESDENIDREIITFTDDLGRTRTGTRADKTRMERRLRAREVGAAELEVMSARPRAPEALIRGDAVQTEAFRPADEAAMEALARRRDRSLTPPEATHYDAAREVRTRGVGFFRFSKDEEVRKGEMEALAAEREATERERERKGEGREARKREVEERRRLIEERRRAAGEKRARKMADNFLEGLAADLDGGEGTV